jgi:hypothetical protein
LVAERALRLVVKVEIAERLPGRVVDDKALQVLVDRLGMSGCAVRALAEEASQKKIC